MYKKCKIVMLPSEKASNIGFYKDTNNLVFNNSNNKDIPRGIFQHLYILSDDKIKEGDWIADKDSIYQFNNVNIAHFLTKGAYKKIIATTNSELYYSKYTGQANKQLPNISQSFTEDYIKAHNEGNIIKEVLVEYLELGTSPGSMIKLNPNNTINIINASSIEPERKYSRNEVIEIIKQYNNILWDSRYREDIITNSIDWFNKNYPK